MESKDSYTTDGGIIVHRRVEQLPVEGSIEALVDSLDEERGVVLASSYEYPGRYTRWDLGFVNPPLVLESCGREVCLIALNDRGRILLTAAAGRLNDLAALESSDLTDERWKGVLRAAPGRFPEEERSRQPSPFSVVRALRELFSDEAEPTLGLYGAFGYDLAFVFEPIRLRHNRPAGQRDLVLYLPDEIVVVDHRRERAERRSYDFEAGGRSTVGLERTGQRRPYSASAEVEVSGDHDAGRYERVVAKARSAMRRGDLFEVVPSQTFFEPCRVTPSALFRRLRASNPSPYGFLVNLGSSEYLVGASPEMYVRVDGRRVETCPISGTIARGKDPVTDAVQVLALLNSDKDESELTMCTDVDRNDKSRVCEPGSVRVIGRRQIEMYSRVIHTVDHVEGTLRGGFDALDAFLTHTWAVTVTGAPKVWAMQFIEDNEASPRAWYGGAVGAAGFNGALNTGLTLRTVRIKDGVAEVRVGATILFDSDPEDEERETHLKASAYIDAIRRPEGDNGRAPSAALEKPGRGRRVLLVDHQDSFVHTLANYLRQTGAEVVTLRAGFPHSELDGLGVDLVVLSPGPGRPRDFDVSGTIAACIERKLPVFGVCLGLQGMVEHFGGSLGVLEHPAHGRASTIRTLGGVLFEGLPGELTVGRYHSLYAREEDLPEELLVTARSDDGVVMAVEHSSLPLAAVQFHPESILSLEGDGGLRLIRNVVARLRDADQTSCASAPSSPRTNVG